MSTVNIVLMILLSAIIGFAIGNVWGKESMKRIFSTLIEQLINGLKTASNQTIRKKEE